MDTGTCFDSAGVAQVQNHRRLQVEKINQSPSAVEITLRATIAISTL